MHDNKRGMEKECHLLGYVGGAQVGVQPTPKGQDILVQQGEIGRNLANLLAHDDVKFIQQGDASHWRIPHSPEVDQLLTQLIDLFISIHSNAGNQTSNYPLTIFNGKSETPSIPAAKVWAQILWEQLITNEATHWTNTAPHYIGDLTLNPSWSLGYGVLYPLTVPGIISEGSFHDYQPEVDRLLNLEYTFLLIMAKTGVKSILDMKRTPQFAILLLVPKREYFFVTILAYFTLRIMVVIGIKYLILMG